MVYTEDQSVGWKDIETKLSFVLVPLIVLSSNIINRQNIVELLKTYVLGAVLAAVFSLLVSTFTFYSTSNTDVFYYSLLSHFQHPGYFSMYLNFAIAIILVLIFHQRGKLNLKYYLALTFLIIFIYQLSSRMEMLILGALILYSLIYLLFPKIKLKTTIAALLISFAFSTVVIYFSSQYINRFDTAIEQLKTQNESSSSGSRLMLWKYSLELFMEHPILGVGTGDVDKTVHKKFVEENFDYAIEGNLNPHNQYLQSAIALGIVGILPLIIQFIFPLFFVRREAFFVYPLFLFIVASSALTESIFERQSGVVFYSVFNAFLFFTLKFNRSDGVEEAKNN